MISLDDFQALKRKVEDLQRKRDTADGAYTQLMKRLKEEFDCEKVKQAERMLERIKEESMEALKKYNELKEAFEKEFAQLLGEVNE